MNLGEGIFPFEEGNLNKSVVGNLLNGQIYIDYRELVGKGSVLIRKMFLLEKFLAGCYCVKCIRRNLAE